MASFATVVALHALGWVLSGSLALAGMARIAFVARLALWSLAGAFGTFVGCILAFTILAFGALSTFAAWIFAFRLALVSQPINLHGLRLVRARGHNAIRGGDRRGPTRLARIPPFDKRPQVRVLRRVTDKHGRLSLELPRKTSQNGCKLLIVVKGGTAQLFILHDCGLELGKLGHEAQLRVERRPAVQGLNQSQNATSAGGGQLLDESASSMRLFFSFNRLARMV